MNAVRTRRVVAAGHHGLAAGGRHGGGDLGRIRCHHHRADLGLRGAAHDAHDHRLAADFRQRLVRQAGRGHAGRNEDQDVGRRHESTAKLREVPRLAVPHAAYPGQHLFAPLIRVASPSANRLCVRQTGAAPAPISLEFLTSGAEPAMDSYELNKILGALLFCCLCVLSLNIAAGAVFAPAQARQARLGSRGSGSRSGRWRRSGGRRGADREAARRCDAREGRERRQEVRRLPYLREGRAEPRRAEPLWRRWTRARLGCGLQLLGRHEEQARQVDGRGPRTPSCRTRRASSPAHR